MVYFLQNTCNSIGTQIVANIIVSTAPYHPKIPSSHTAPNYHHSKPATAAPPTNDSPDVLSRTASHRQAHTLAYLDTFWTLAVLCALMFGLAFFLKKNDPNAGSQVAVG